MSTWKLIDKYAHAHQQVTDAFLQWNTIQQEVNNKFMEKTIDTFSNMDEPQSHHAE